jgi:4-amino-4-deoxy-L-arabinose transferase-like glycosyltransferase
MSSTLNDRATATAIPTRVLVIQAVLITLIVVGTIMRFCHPFLFHPLDSLWSDNERHFHNAFDVKGTNLESILNTPGFEVFLATVFRITGQDRYLVAFVWGILSCLTPFVWYQWLRELTRDKTISLLGYAVFTFLPSYFRIFAFCMDSIILLPLTGTALWLTWRAARKARWQSSLTAAFFCGAACATKSVALPVVFLPWLYVGYYLNKRLPRRKAISMWAGSVALFIVVAGLGPLKVWSHTGCFVPLPDGLYNQRYFESGAHDIQVTSFYRNMDGGGEYVEVCVWGSSSVCYPPLYPFSNWMSGRQGRYAMVMDYKHGRDRSPPINLQLRDRLRWIGENIIFFFFQYQWPEDNDWDKGFPAALPTMVRFIWLPLCLFTAGCVLWKRKREFMGWYFIAVTLCFMFQQSAVMEGRYKKLWEGVAIGAFLNVIAQSKRYRKFTQIVEMPKSEIEMSKV